MENDINKIIDDHIALTRNIPNNHLHEIKTIVNWIVETLTNGKKIIFAGNGGSAADAQHLAAEFIGRFEKERRSLPAIALSTDTSILTALGNDYGFESVFSRQIEGLASQGDLFYAISTSGNSTNVISAVEKCKNIPCKTIGMLGRDGGKLKKNVDLAVIVDSNNTARIQEIHEIIGHIICFLVEKELFG